MKFEQFLSNHWEIFLSHLCQYHPLPIPFLSKYDYELDWTSISKNKNIVWDEVFLQRFEGRLSWHDLAKNESIVWHSSLIKKFKKRLDWYYLGRNKNLPISKDFIEEHHKKMLLIESNVHLTPALITQYGKTLLPAIEVIPPELTETQLQHLDETIRSDNHFNVHTYHNLYSDYILPHLQKQSIDQIFEDLFDYSQRYFLIRPIQNDVHGLAPEFLITGKNIFGQYRKGRGLFKISNKIKLENGSLQEGPPRLYEMPRFSGMSYYPVLLVSENIKRILERFKISTHKFIPVTLKPKKIKTELEYYIFQIDYESFLKQADFSTLHFRQFKKKDWFGKYQKETMEKGAIENFETISKLSDKLKKRGFQYSKFIPFEYKVDTEDDIFTIEGNIIVNEYVVQAIEAALPNQVQFESAQLFNIKVPQAKYDAKLNSDEKQAISLKDSKTTLSKELKYYFEKAKRLEQETMKRKLSIPADEFQDIQRKFNVILPESFKRKYRQHDIDTEEYDFLPISEFYVQNEYASRSPKTYKSLIVAENGCGDFLGLILKKENDFELKQELYEFNHETGEVEKYL